MPILRDEDMEMHPIQGAYFTFSAIRITRLGATDQTLAVIAVDTSGSTISFRRQMEAAMKSIIESCRRSPRADSMLVRAVKFDTAVEEIHGFKPLVEIAPTSYDHALGNDGGMTALYDAAYTAIESSRQFGATLVANEFATNAVVFVITDGCNNSGTMTASMVRQALGNAVASEDLESIRSVFIGIGPDQATLKRVSDDCGFDQYVEVATADPNTLAKLAQFVSQSMTSQSQALGTGGPSKQITF